MEEVKQSTALLQNAHLFAEIISFQREEEKERKKTPGCLSSGPRRDLGGTGRTSSPAQALCSSEAQQSQAVWPHCLRGGLQASKHRILNKYSSADYLILNSHAFTFFKEIWQRKPGTYFWFCFRLHFILRNFEPIQ